MKINMQCPINKLGYGYASLGFLRALNEANHEVALWPIGQVEADNSDHEMIAKSIANQNVYSKMAPSLRIWHQFDLAQHIGKGRQFGFPFFELDTFTQREKRHLQQQDVIIVPSKWAKQVIDKEINSQLSFEVPVEIVPLGVDTEVFKPTRRTPNDMTVFLSVGKWELRKGHDVICDAFNKAFTVNDNVELWMMCWNPFLQPQANNGVDGNLEWSRYFKESPLGGKIMLLPRANTQAQVAEVMNLADVGLFPARAEGWNLEALEMMACGKDIIVTNYAAHTEFCSRGNSFLIDVDEAEPALDGKWFHGQGNWAKLGDKQIDQIVDYMRVCHKANQNGVMKNSMAVETAKQFSWSHAAEKLVGVLSNA